MFNGVLMMFEKIKTWWHLYRKHVVFAILMLASLFWGLIGLGLLNVIPGLGLFMLFVSGAMGWVFWRMVYKEDL